MANNSKGATYLPQLSRNVIHQKPLDIDPSERPALCQEEYVYNFAYGSNMGPEKLKTRAGGIVIISAKPAFVRNYRLAFNLASIPPIEPVMAGVEPEEGTTIHGTLYKLRRPQYEKLYRSEGGGGGRGRVYLEEEVTAETYSGEKVQAVAFRVTPRVRLPRDLEVPASKRYLDLLMEGAKSIGLEKDYVRGLEEMPRAPPCNAVEKVIARFFATFFFFWVIRTLPGVPVLRYFRARIFRIYHRKEVLRQSPSPLLRLLAYPLLVVMLIMMLPGSLIGVVIFAARTCSSYVEKGMQMIKVFVPEREAKLLKVA